MSTTLRQLVDSIESSLHSYTGIQETYTWLTADADASTTTLSVDDSTQVMRGIAEIEDELLFVHAADTDVVSLAPFGRGYRGTTAAAHTANTPLLFDPAFPRAEVKKRINAVIASLHPTLYQIKTTAFTGDGFSLNLPLPVSADQVTSVSYQVPGDPTGYWQTHQDYRTDPLNQDGNALLLGYPVTAGAQAQVTYRAPYGALSADTDTLADAGIPESCADLIEYGVTAHMLRFLEPARLQITAMENVSRAQVVQAGDASKVSAQLYAMYQQRLSEERRKLLLLLPPTINYQG